MESVVQDLRRSEQEPTSVDDDARYSFSQLDIRIFLEQVSRLVVLGFINSEKVARPAPVSAELVKVESVRIIVQRVAWRRAKPLADGLFDAVTEVRKPISIVARSPTMVAVWVPTTWPLLRGLGGLLCGLVRLFLLW